MTPEELNEMIQDDRDLDCIGDREEDIDSQRDFDQLPIALMGLRE